MDLLARREHSERELNRKLAQRFPDCQQAISEQVQRLAEEGLQSDRRFAESYLRMRCNAGFGPVRIRQELRERGVDDPLLNAVMGDCAVDWQSQAERVYCKKFGAGPAKDRRELAKRQRFLHYRGFDTELVQSVCKVMCQ